MFLDSFTNTTAIHTCICKMVFMRLQINATLFASFFATTSQFFVRYFKRMFCFSFLLQKSTTLLKRIFNKNKRYANE